MGRNGNKRENETGERGKELSEIRYMELGKNCFINYYIKMTLIFHLKNDVLY